MNKQTYIYNPYPEYFINIYDFTLKWIVDNIPTHSTIIDIGCNNGYLTSYIKENCCPSKIVGIDIDEKQVQLANSKYNNIAFFCIDGEDKENLKELEKFDVVFMRNTFHHFKKKNEIITYYKDNLLNSNGIIIIIDLDAKSNFSLCGIGTVISTLFATKTLGIKKVITMIKNTNFFQKSAIREHRNSDKKLLKRQKWLKLTDIQSNFSLLFDRYYFLKQSFFIGFGGIYYFKFINK